MKKLTAMTLIGMAILAMPYIKTLIETSAPHPAHGAGNQQIENSLQFGFRSLRFEDASILKQEAIRSFRDMLLAANVNRPQDAIRRIITETRESEQRLRQADEYLSRSTERKSTKPRLLIDLLAGLATVIAVLTSEIGPNNGGMKSPGGPTLKTNRNLHPTVEMVNQEGVAPTVWDIPNLADIAEQRLIDDLNDLFNRSAQKLENLVKGAKRRYRRSIPTTKVAISRQIIIHQDLKDHAQTRKAATQPDIQSIGYMLAKDALIILVKVPFIDRKRKVVQELYDLPSVTFNTKNGNRRFYKKEHFVKHNLDELKQCKRKRRLYMCAEQAPKYKGPSTCIEALFQQHSPKIKSLCKLELQKQGIPALQFGNHDLTVANAPTVNDRCGYSQEDMTNPGRMTTEVKSNCSNKRPEKTLPPLTLNQAARVAEHLLHFQTGSKIIVIQVPAMRKLVNENFQIPEFWDYDKEVQVKDTTEKVIFMSVILALMMMTAYGGYYATQTCQKRRQEAPLTEQRPGSMESLDVRSQFSGNSQKGIFPASPPPTLCELATTHKHQRDQGLVDGQSQGREDVPRAQPRQAQTHDGLAARVVRTESRQDGYVRIEPPAQALFLSLRESNEREKGRDERKGKESRRLVEENEWPPLVPNEATRRQSRRRGILPPTPTYAGIRTRLTPPHTEGRRKAYKASPLPLPQVSPLWNALDEGGAGSWAPPRAEPWRIPLRTRSDGRKLSDGTGESEGGSLFARVNEQK